ncbi:hypothetical protein ACQP1G_17090 [Nocardia sp. CA-107356]|uniref:hypothetical protein n=1 Tax=Nocardia sp. CA-107356 TaxID=3239972 RepID=UPI003D948A11
MKMDVREVQGIARDLKTSAVNVNETAMRVGDTVRKYAPAQAGRAYEAIGKTLGPAFEKLPRHLYSWSNCVHDCGEAIGLSASTFVGVDKANAANLGAVERVFV